MKYLLILNIKTVASGWSLIYYDKGEKHQSGDDWDITCSVPHEETIECDPLNLPKKLEETKKVIAQKYEQALNASLMKTPAEKRESLCEAKYVSTCDVTINITQIIPLE